MLEVEGLQVNYGPIRALQSCNLKAPLGTITAVLGANGAGKSTLMKAIAGLVRPGAGRIRIDGTDITHLPAHQRARMGISFAMEGRRLFHRMSIEENLKLAWDFRQTGGRFQEALDKTYSRFPVLASRKSLQAGLLSGGQQQMLVLSSALIHQPRYLLLDEPSLGLAPQIVQQIFSAIETARQELGTTIVLCEQVAALALSVSQQGYVLRRGEVVQGGTAAEISNNPNLSISYLGA